MVSFIKNIARPLSLAKTVCAVCKKKFNKGQDTTSHRVGNVFHSVHVPCLQHWLRTHGNYCPECQKPIIDIKDREFPIAEKIVFLVVGISFTVMVGSLLVGIALVSHAPYGTPGPVSAGRVVPVLVGSFVTCLTGMASVGVLGVVEGKTSLVHFDFEY